ncbi:hypothetical protein PLUTE_b6006 [Pseudoalteromonas luteoviolacea DSM 6061]|nr:hypothetical protein [Pseudoalteromonas luteoviolacea DSM 6061]
MFIELNLNPMQRGVFLREIDPESTHQTMMYDKN